MTKDDKDELSYLRERLKMAREKRKEANESVVHWNRKLSQARSLIKMREAGIDTSTISPPFTHDEDS